MVNDRGVTAAVLNPAPKAGQRYHEHATAMAWLMNVM